MATVIKTVVATGASSGLGFEAIKQLLSQAQPYNFILGARDTKRTQAAFEELKADHAKHSLTILPLDLTDLKNVKAFAQEAIAKVGDDKLDYLLLNAGHTDAPGVPNPTGSKWREGYVVNHLSQHYLMHLLYPKLVSSQSRIIFVSSGAVRNVPDPAAMDKHLKSGSDADWQTVYADSKFAQLLGAHWWRRKLTGFCKVLAVSPGLIPGTGLGRGSGISIPSHDLPDAKSIPEGARSILNAFTRDDFPADPEQIFLTSWGEWWAKDVYGNSLDKSLQEKWCLSKEDLEKAEGVST